MCVSEKLSNPKIPAILTQWKQKGCQSISKMYASLDIGPYEPLSLNEFATIFYLYALFPHFIST